jgi:LacI family transcriptional regulator
MITLGHKRIGMLTANLESVPSRERVLGFRRAMDEAGLAIPRTFIKSSHSTKLDGFTRESGYEVMQQFIALGRQMPTALIVSSDIQASGALNALADAGLHCPDDISIVGFDDIDLASHIGLTTMRQPMFEMGELATDLLMERLAHAQREPTHSLFVPKLVIRKTSKALQHTACAAKDNAA